MKRFKRIRNSIIISLAMFLSIFFNGCTAHHYHFIYPEYPDLPKIEKVSEVKNATIRDGCLYFDENNTNLCGDNLKIVLTQIEKLRINETTCETLLNKYNKFIKEQKENRKKDEVDYSFGI